MIFLTLYSRSYCHLCDDMAEALGELTVDIPHQMNIIDIDADPALLALYDELVPVLFGSKVPSQVGEQLCHYFLDVEQFRMFCEA